jgi:hypothetical protein
MPQDKVLFTSNPGYLIEGYVKEQRAIGYSSYTLGWCFNAAFSLSRAANFAGIVCSKNSNDGPYHYTSNKHNL